MNRIQELLKQLKVRLQGLLERIEQSALFEKVVNKYDGLEPRRQEWIRFFGKALVVVGIVYIVISPLWNAIQGRSEIAALYNLSSDVETFNMEIQQQKQGYKAPPGWTSFAANNDGEFKESFKSYLAQIGIPEDFYDIQNSPESFDLKVTELSLRQLQALTFKIDGFYPAVYFSQYNVSVHPDNKELLQLDASIVYKQELAGEIPAGVGGVHATSGDGGEDNYEAARPSARGGSGGSRGFVAPPPSGRGNNYTPGSNNEDHNSPMDHGRQQIDPLEIPGSGGVDSGIEEDFLPPDLEPPPDMVEEIE